VSFGGSINSDAGKILMGIGQGGKGKGEREKERGLRFLL
jgi:hypothetical protein